MIRQYIVEWQGRGFYARRQPNYDWSFTDDPALAAPYRSQKAALERAAGHKFGSGQPCAEDGKRLPYRIVEVDGNFAPLAAPGEWLDRPVKPPRPVEYDPPITLASLSKKEER